MTALNFTDRVRRAIEEAGECDYGHETRASVHALLRFLGAEFEERVEQLARERSGYDVSHVDFFRRAHPHDPVVMRVANEGAVFMDGTHRLAACVKFGRLTVPLVVLGYAGDEDVFWDAVREVSASPGRRR